jgi:AmmeMemoRadiSam system protein A
MDEGVVAALLHYARETIASAIAGGDPPRPECTLTGLGCFVTIELAGRLRGCMGYTVFPGNLAECVRLSALAAAFEDPRFPPLDTDELARCSIELTILSEPSRVEIEKLSNPERVIRIGTHGIMVTRGGRAGVLLPQVALEHSFDALEFLRATCEKAGLEEDCWKKKGTQVFVFQGRVFREVDGRSLS